MKRRIFVTSAKGQVGFNAILRNEKYLKKRRKIMTKLIEKHTHKEEILHSLTHGIAGMLSVIGLILLVMKTASLGKTKLIGSIIFGVSLILLYSASAIYHASPYETRSREVLQKLDHCMIYVLILGTYVPACLTALGGWLGWAVFAIVATCCITGVIINLIDIGRFYKLSIVLYVVSGWMIAVVAVPFIKTIGWQGFTFLLLGGLFYTAGLIFYRMTKTRYMHFVWHVFVMLGSLMHFVMVYLYVY